jgi:uncharacterized protein YjiS (DUF1127 family)
MTYIVNDSFAPSKQHPSLIARIKAAHALYQQRKVLSNLTDEQLTDIGLTRQDVNEENAKSLWV